jgi:hypothetical protein
MTILLNMVVYIVQFPIFCTKYKNTLLHISSVTSMIHFVYFYQINQPAHRLARAPAAGLDDLAGMAIASST